MNAKNIAKYYDTRVRKYGAGWKAADYGCRESQQRKFEVLASVIPEHELIESTVLDVGCGSGHFAKYIEPATYTGWDISPAMVCAAKRRGVNAVERNLFADPPKTKSYDIVTANGIFYLLDEKTAHEWMFKAAKAMFDACRVAVAFNSLSDYALKKKAGEFYAQPCAALIMAQSITRHVTLRHDYHDRDFTVYMYREKQ